MRNIIVAIFKTGSGSLVSLLLSIASIKIMAVFLGPSGVGLFSLIKQAMLTFSSFGFGSQTAVVQGIASKKGVERDSYIRSTFWLFLLGTIFSVVVIQLFADEFAILLLGKSDELAINLIRWIGLPATLSNLYIYFKSLINGFGAIGKLAIVEVLGPLGMLFLIYPICIYGGEETALAFVLLLSVSQALMFFVALFICIRKSWLSIICKVRHFIDNSSAIYFIKFAGVTLLTAMLSTSSILAVRLMVKRHGGFYEAGLFDLAWSLSGSYVMLILGAFGTYFMPVLSNSSDFSERRTLISNVMRLSTLLMTPMIVAIIAIKPLLIKMLYSTEFIPSLELVRWMLVGDYLKITSWIFAITVLANANMKRYFWVEVFWNIGFVLLSALALFGFDQLQGIGVAFIFLYIFINAIYLDYVYKTYRLKFDVRLVGSWILGLAIIISVSWYTWDDQWIDWIMFPSWISLIFIFIFISLRKLERIKLLNMIFKRN